MEIVSPVLDKHPNMVYFNLQIIRKFAHEVSVMTKYTTKQRMLLMDFLSEHTDEILSTGQIAKELSGKGISTSAIYRNLAALEEEGRLKRSVKPGSQETYYRYIDGEHCRGHLHLSCLRCGKTVHVEETGTDALAHQLAKSEGFALDRTGTVLYGICADCQE